MPTSRAHRAQGVILKRNFVPLALALLPMLLTPLELVLGLAVFGGEGPWMVGLSLSICASWLALGVIWSRNSWPHKQRGALQVDERGVFIDERLVVPAETIESAAPARSPWGQTFVRVRVRGALRSLVIPIADAATGQTIISALRLDAAHARASYTLPWRLFRWGTGLSFYLYLWLVALVALIPGLMASRGNHGDLTPLGIVISATIGFGLVTGYWWLWFRSRLHVTFGTDGLWLRQWGRQRIVRWDEVREIAFWPGPSVRGVRAASEGFDLVLSGGERVPFYTARERMRVGEPTTDVIAERLRATMRAAESQARAERVALPQKRGGDMERWIADLRRAGSGQDAGLRRAAVDPEQLWSVVEDATHAPRERAAAAAALSGASDSSIRVRLRAASAAVASPRLRAAMEAAAEDDEQRLARALEELEKLEGEG